MALKPRRNGCREPQATEAWGGEEREQRAQGGTRRLTRKSDVAHTNSTLNAAKNTAVTWTIGSRRNGNSRMGRFVLSRPIRKEFATVAD